MKSRKSVFQFIAHRYGLGYAEINNTNTVYLISAYLPNHTEVNDAERPELPDTLDHDPFYKEQLDISGCYSSYITHLYSSRPEAQLSEEQVVTITKEMDKRFTPVKLKKNITQHEEKQNKALFSHYQVGIKNPINSEVLYHSGLGEKKVCFSQYSIILDFSSSAHLQRFLSGIPEESKMTAHPQIYAIYECTYGFGCYQILVSHGYEHKALRLLLGENIYAAELPVTRYMLDRLQPKTFLSSLLASSLSDEQYAAALGIIQKCSAKKENSKLIDFDESTKKVIESNSGLKQSFLSTVEFFKEKNDSIVGLLDGIFPRPITNIVMSYRTSQLRRG